MERKVVIRGTESFEELITRNIYYVDKTDFIQTVFGPTGAKVQLITRPRRFGKTLTMRTFESFLALNPDNPGDVSKQLRLFAGTHILSDEGSPDEVAARKKFVQDFMGKYPVIFLTLKSVDGNTFKSAYGRFADNVVDFTRRFGYLQQSPKISPALKEDLARLELPLLMRNSDFADDLKSTLKFLTAALTIHHGVPPIILIDEYDVPLAKAEANGYYKEMLELIKAFLDPLKTNDNFSFAVLTGCLRVSKESIFTGLNNFSTNSIFDNAKPAYSSAIGFTKEETEALLEYYDLSEYKEKVKENYDGYRFGGISMFCPWDVLCFCDDAKDAKAAGIPVLFDNYWTNTSGNQIIDEFADYIRPEHIDDMQTLVDGGTISVGVRKDLNYPDMERHEIDAFWTMLLFTGYLTLSHESSFNLKESQQVRIPNLEIRECFADRILTHFKSNPQVVNDSLELARAFLAGDAEKIAACIGRKLRSFISIRDLSSKSPYEDVYHSFLNGCFSSCSAMIGNFRSNQEAGDGYADISFTSDDESVAAVIELKQTANEREMDSLADEAVEQICVKDYAGNYLSRSMIRQVFAYGICFCRKSCSVSVKKLR